MRLLRVFTQCQRAAAAGQALFGHRGLAELDEATPADAIAEVRPFRLETGATGATGAAGEAASWPARAAPQAGHVMRRLERICGRPAALI